MNWTLLLEPSPSQASLLQNRGDLDKKSSPSEAASNPPRPLPWSKSLGKTIVSGDLRGCSDRPNSQGNSDANEKHEPCANEEQQISQAIGGEKIAAPDEMRFEEKTETNLACPRPLSSRTVGSFKESSRPRTGIAVSVTKAILKPDLLNTAPDFSPHGLQGKLKVRKGSKKSRNEILTGSSKPYSATQLVGDLSLARMGSKNSVLGDLPMEKMAPECHFSGDLLMAYKNSHCRSTPELRRSKTNLPHLNAYETSKRALMSEMASSKPSSSCPSDRSIASSRKTPATAPLRSGFAMLPTCDKSCVSAEHVRAIPVM